MDTQALSRYVAPDAAMVLGLIFFFKFNYIIASRLWPWLWRFDSILNLVVPLLSFAISVITHNYIVRGHRYAAAINLVK